MKLLFPFALFAATKAQHLHVEVDYPFTTCDCESGVVSGSPSESAEELGLLDLTLEAGTFSCPTDGGPGILLPASDDFSGLEITADYKPLFLDFDEALLGSFMITVFYQGGGDILGDVLVASDDADRVVYGTELVARDDGSVFIQNRLGNPEDDRTLDTTVADFTGNAEDSEYNFHGIAFFGTISTTRLKGGYHTVAGSDQVLNGVFGGIPDEFTDAGLSLSSETATISVFKGMSFTQDIRLLRIKVERLATDGNYPGGFIPDLEATPDLIFPHFPLLNFIPDFYDATLTDVTFDGPRAPGSLFTAAGPPPEAISGGEPFILALGEDSAVFQLNTRVVASDAEESLVFSLIESTPAGSVEIDSTSGAATVSRPGVGPSVVSFSYTASSADTGFDCGLILEETVTVNGVVPTTSPTINPTTPTTGTPTTGSPTTRSPTNLATSIPTTSPTGVAGKLVPGFLMVIVLVATFV